MIKKIILGVLTLGLLLIAGAFLLPRNAHVERKISIARPPATIFATVNTMREFSKWSPWQRLDPAMRQGFEGPATGVGSKMTWSGNDKVGSGSQVITASVPDQLVRFDVDFGKMGTAKAAIVLVPDAASTQVTWTLDTDMGAGPFGRYIGLMMDHMVGKDYETGLANLKRLEEGG